METPLDTPNAVALQHPDEMEFLDDLCVDALTAIRGHTAGKKRAAVLHIAIARASGLTMQEILDDGRTVGPGTWYNNWRNEPEVQDALEILTDRAMRWHDRETARVESVALSECQRALAWASVDAVNSLRAIAIDPEVSPKARMDACTALLGMAQAALAQRLALVQRGTVFAVDTSGVDVVLERELQRAADMRELAAAMPTRGEEPW